MIFYQWDADIGLGVPLGHISRHIICTKTTSVPHRCSFSILGFLSSSSSSSSLESAQLIIFRNPAHHLLGNSSKSHGFETQSFYSSFRPLVAPAGQIYRLVTYHISHLTATHFQISKLVCIGTLKTTDLQISH